MQTLCSRACALWLVPCCAAAVCPTSFFFLFFSTGGRSPRLSAREEVGSPHLPPKNKKKKRPPAFCRAGRAGRKRWTPQHVPPSHPEPKATVHLCTYALCARLHKTQYPMDIKCLCSRACALWLVPCCAAAVCPTSFFFFSSPRGKISSPQRQRGGGLPAPPPSTPEPASSPHKVKARPSNPHNPTALNVWEVLKPKPARAVRTDAPGRDTFVQAGRQAIRIAPPASGQHLRRMRVSRASGELPADTQPHGTMGSPKAQRAHDKHEIGRQANSPPAYRHRGTMGLPQSSTRTRRSARPGASGLPASTQA